MDDCVLIRPTKDHLTQIRNYRTEFADCLDWLHGAVGLMHIEDPEEWLQYIERCENTQTVPQGQAPSSQFIYIRQSDHKIVGMANIRHKATEPLATWGGHVGYSVCPSERRKGYATRILRDTLPLCRALGLERILLTAGDENVGSVKAIKANGGTLEGYVMSPKHHVMVGRYWIELT